MSPGIPAAHEAPLPPDVSTAAEDVVSWRRSLVMLAAFVTAFTAYGWLVQLMDPGTNWTLLGPLMGSMFTIIYRGQFPLRRRRREARSRYAWIAMGAGMVTVWGLGFGLDEAIHAAWHPGLIQFATSMLAAVIGLCVFVVATRLLRTREPAR